MGSALRVLMVSANYHPVIGGVETHISQVAPRLIQTGIDVEILTTDRSRRLPEREVVAGVPVRRVPAFPAGGDYYLAPRLLALVEEGDWDLVHCQGYHTFVPPIAMLGARRARLPYVVTFHSGGHSSVLRHRLRGLQTLALRPMLIGASRLIAVSEFEAELFRSRLRLRRERFAVIPNGATTGVAGRSPQSAGQSGLILSIGRLERYKGHDRAIRALAHLVATHPQARLRIIGSGSGERELHSLARRLGVDDRVVIGPIAGGDTAAMAEQLARASLVVQLSDYESNGLAAMEAAASGCPVLVTATSGLAEIAQRGWATAVSPAADPDRIAAAMASLIDAGPRPAPVGLPTWDDTAAALAKLYQEILVRRGPMSRRHGRPA